MRYSHGRNTSCVDVTDFSSDAGSVAELDSADEDLVYLRSLLYLLEQWHSHCC